MNHGACFGSACAAAIFEPSGVTPRLQPTTSAAFGARANRPAYSVLDNANLRLLGLDDLRHWRLQPERITFPVCLQEEARAIVRNRFLSLTLIRR